MPAGGRQPFIAAVTTCGRTSRPPHGSISCPSPRPAAGISATRPVRLGDSSPRRPAPLRRPRPLPPGRLQRRHPRRRPSRTTWPGLCAARSIEVQAGARLRRGADADDVRAVGTGRSWAERRVTVAGRRAASHRGGQPVGAPRHETGRPEALPDEFFDDLRRGAAVNARCRRGCHPNPARRAVRAVAAPLHRLRRARPHEQRRVLVGGRGGAVAARDLRPPMLAEVEFRVAIEPGATTCGSTCDTDDRLEMWMVVGSTRARERAVVTLGLSPLRRGARRPRCARRRRRAGAGARGGRRSRSRPSAPTSAARKRCCESSLDGRRPAELGRRRRGAVEALLVVAADRPRRGRRGR